MTVVRRGIEHERVVAHEGVVLGEGRILRPVQGVVPREGVVAGPRGGLVTLCRLEGLVCAHALLFRGESTALS